MATSNNRRTYGYSATHTTFVQIRQSRTSYVRKTLSEIQLGGLSIDLKGWNQLWYYGESNYEPRN